MEKIVFTNGCFDLLHPGHTDLLERARALGTKLIVGINSDASVKAIKGAARPFCTQEERRAVLLALRAVDEVRIFEETTPERLIREIKPDVLVKGGDWSVEQIVGADFVLEQGGEVYSLPLVGNFSTSRIAEKILAAETPRSEKAPNDKRREKNPDEEAGVAFIESLARALENLRDEQTEQLENCAKMLRETRQARKNIYLYAERANAESDFKDGYLTKGFRRVYTPAAFEKEARSGDLLIVLGADSERTEIIEMVMTARRKGCRTIVLTDARDRKTAALCDAALLIDAGRESVISAAQRSFLEFWRESAEAETGADF